MRQDQIIELQNVQLSIMDEIHRVCVENNLRYYMIGGTALGAIRHGGFIPWDVDIDIAMPRRDYEEFISNYSKLLHKSFSCHSYKTDKNYHIPHAIVVLNNSYIEYRIDKLNPHINRIGIYVDILPLDQSPDDPDARKKQQKRILQIKSFLESRLSLVYESDSFITRFLKHLRHTILSIIPINWVYRHLNNIMQQYNDIECQNWCSMVSHYPFSRLTMSKEIFGTPTLVPFAGRKYFGPERIDVYLEHTFGDYNRLPSQESIIRQMENIVSASWPDTTTKE